MIKKYTLKNLDCASCAHKIENMINQREDINEATLSFANGLLSYRYTRIRKAYSSIRTRSHN